jgi:hypothetical protein
VKLLNIWAWESLENLPLLLGFVIAARLWDGNIPAGVLVLISGMALGVLITRLVEPKLHKNRHQVRWVSSIVNFLLFVALAFPFLYYFNAQTAWTNWKSDLFLGIAAGLLLTFVQSLHWTGIKTRMLWHGLAMVAAFPLIMLGIRYTIRMDGLGLSVFYTVLIILMASLIIALIDYQEMYRE